MIRRLLVAALLALGAAATIAQPPPPPTECSPDYQAEAQAAFVQYLQAATTALEGGDTATWLLNLRYLRIISAAADALCSELAFSSETSGLQAVIGPVLFPDGIYRVTLTTTGFAIIKPEVLGGECETADFGGLYNIMQGRASDGAQTLFTTTGCLALLTVSNTSQPWTLTFELILPNQ